METARWTHEKAFGRARQRGRIRAVLLVLVVILVPTSIAQSPQAQGSIVVEVEPTRVELRAPASQLVHVWVNGTIMCEPATQPPWVYFRPDIFAIGDDGEHLRVESDRWDWQSTQDPGSPNRYRVDRLVEVTFNASLQPERTSSHTIGWRVDPPGFINFPPSCTASGYRWSIARQERVEAVLIGRDPDNRSDPSSTPASSGENAAANNASAPASFPTFGGRSTVPSEAIVLGVAFFGALCLLVFSAVRRR